MYCSSSKLISFVEGKNENRNGYKEISKLSSEEYTIIDYARHLMSFNLVVDSGISTTCSQIDISQLHFIKTKNKKKINKWMCDEYIPVDTVYKDIAIWATSNIPFYIHPEIYCNDIKGGIVQIIYKNRDKFTLHELNTLTAIKVYSSDCSQKDIRDKIDLLKRLMESFE